jgi:4a-hydroxytetrahydrobiopterin dehydratase
MRAPLTTRAIEAALEGLPGWRHADEKLQREYKLPSFEAAVAFIVRIGFLAAAKDHHPEIWNVYSTVRIALNTHDAGGRVTAMDVELARAIEAVSGS